jgi:hypothetical protein
MGIHLYSFVVTPDCFVSNRWQELDEINNFSLKPKSLKASNISVVGGLQDISRGDIMGFDK